MDRSTAAHLACLPDGYLALDRDGLCTYANPEAARLLCRPLQALIGIPFILVEDGSAAEVDRELKRAAGDRTCVELEFYHPSAEHWLEVRTCPIPDGLAVHLRDVSDRKRAEEELRRGQRELLDFFENAKEGLHWVGPDGTILWANQAEMDLLGYTREEYIGRSIREFHADADLIEEILCRLTSGGELINQEARLRCKDGSIREVLISSNALYFEGEFIHTRCFTRDITDRRLAEDALRAQAEALRAADRRKDEFLAMLAHELRNPLSPILTAVEILRLRAPGDPLVQRQQEVISRQVGVMKRHLDDLLDVSRITRSKVELSRARVDLRAVLNDTVETSRALLEERRHQLHLAVPAERLEVDGDEVRLCQIFTNLLNNAARYTPPGGEIRLTADRRDDTVRVRISDTGIGMTPEVLSRAFDLFAQGERGLDRSEGGLGIGLTLVRELVERHGGTVTASSPGKDQGSEFVVTLPLTKG